MELMYQRMKTHLTPTGTIIWSTTTPGSMMMNFYRKLMIFD